MNFSQPDRVNDTSYRLTATTSGCVGPPSHQMFMGGATTAAAIAALEDNTGRPVAWASAQFLGRTMEGDEIDIHVETQPGRTLTQATATLSTNGAITSTVRTALGHGDRRDDPTQFTTMPVVPDPNDCELRQGGAWATAANLLGQVERRVAHEDPDRGHERLWLRLTDGLDISAAVLAIFAEFMPGAHPTTRGGSGLDLTIRFVQHTQSEWVLTDTQLTALAHGLFHTTSHIYGHDGTLMAIASQTGRLPRAPQAQ